MACGAFAALAVTTVVLLRISIPLGLLVLIGSIPLIALIQFLGRTLESHSGHEQAGAARAAGVANDLVSGLRVLKGIGAEDAAIERYRLASRDSLKARSGPPTRRRPTRGSILRLRALSSPSSPSSVGGWRPTARSASAT